MGNVKLSVLAGLLLAGTAVFGANANSIIGSPHDLSSTGMSNISGTTNANGEICVFCHTPHASNTAFNGAPLWNKKSMTSTAFTMYGAADAASTGKTIAGTDTDTDPGSPSLACLSCHDGVSSIDSIVNAPGSGSGSLLNGGIAGTDLLIGTIGNNDNAAIGALSGANVLSDTHPISIIYGGPLTGGQDYVSGPASLRPQDANLSTASGSAWSGATTVGDLLRGPDSDKVECGSCHDPHNGTAKTTELRAVEVNFLRHSNSGSKLCIGCHDK